MSLVDFAPSTLVYTPTDPPYEISASSFFAVYPPCNAFTTPGVNGPQWAGTGGGTDWIQFVTLTGEQNICVSYAIGMYDSVTARAPQDWTLQGSNDGGSTWTTVDTQTGQTGWTTSSNRTFTPAVQTTAYSSFRMNITANNGDGTYTSVANIHLYANSTSVVFPGHFSPLNMTSDTAPSPFVASASSTFSPGQEYYPFSGVGGQYWIGTGSGVDWLELDTGFVAGYPLSVYSVRAQTINRAPKNFTMQGSNDGSTWTTLDTRTLQTGWAAGEVRNYALGSLSANYRYFRLNITANNGDATYTEVAVLWLWGPTSVATGFGQVGAFLVGF